MQRAKNSFRSLDFKPKTFDHKTVYTAKAHTYLPIFFLLITVFNEIWALKAISIVFFGGSKLEFNVEWIVTMSSRINLWPDFKYPND